MKPAEMLEALRAQHRAIDQLMAERATLDTKFYPSRSGAIWDAVILGHNAILRLEAELKDQPHFECPACNRVSYHPKDIEFGYCGNCHDFTGEGNTGESA